LNEYKNKSRSKVINKTSQTFHLCMQLIANGWFRSFERGDHSYLTLQTYRVTRPTET